MTAYRQGSSPNFNRAARNGRTGDKSKAYLNEVKKRQQAHARFVRSFVFLFFVVVISVVTLFYFGLKTDFCVKHFGVDSPITKMFANMSKSNANKSEADFSLPFGLRRKNILLLGVDASENPDDLWTGTRTDTIILVNIDSKSKSINAVSIPRDSKVYLPDNNGVQKINAAHAIGGVEMTVKTVENTLGVKVDRYIMVHDDAVKEIVKALGGVNVYVEKNMYYNDNAGRLHINLAKGNQHLSPEEAVGYLRFRHDPMGDIGRTQRQQWFLRGILAELKKPESISKIPDIVGVARKYIKTNMSMYELTQFAMMMKHVDMDKIEIATLPGAPNKKGYISYWILDPEKTQEVLNRLIYRKKIANDFDEPVTASIVYTDGQSAQAQDIRAKLKEDGIVVACESHISKTHSQFIAHKSRITSDYYTDLKKSVPEINGYQFVYEPAIFMCADTDFTVVVAGR